MWDEQGILQLLSGPTLSWYVSLQTTIAKCDVGRAFILERFGGVYADADVDPKPRLRDMWDECLKRGDAVFPADKAMGRVNNYLIASPQGAPFWPRYLSAVTEAITTPPLRDVLYALLRPTWPVLSSHGPVLISRLGGLASSIPTSELGFHGWEGGGESAWYRTTPERVQRHVALLTLILALWGVVLSLWVLVVQLA